MPNYDHVFRHFWMDDDLDSPKYTAMEFLDWYHPFVEKLMVHQPDVMNDSDLKLYPQVSCEDDDRRSQRTLAEEEQRWSPTELLMGWRRFADIWHARVRDAGLKYVLYQERRLRQQRAKTVTHKLCGFCGTEHSSSGWACFRQPGCFVWWEPDSALFEQPPEHEAPNEDDDDDDGQNETPQKRRVSGLEHRRRINRQGKLYESTATMKNELAGIDWGVYGCVWACHHCLMRFSTEPSKRPDPDSDGTVEPIQWKQLKRPVNRTAASSGKKSSASSLLDHAVTYSNRPVVIECGRCSFPHWHPTTVNAAWLSGAGVTAPSGNAPDQVVQDEWWGICTFPPVRSGMLCAGQCGKEGVQAGQSGVHGKRFHPWAPVRKNNDGQQPRQQPHGSEFRGTTVCDCCIDWMISARVLSERSRMPGSKKQEMIETRRIRQREGTELKKLLTKA